MKEKLKKIQQYALDQLEQEPVTGSRFEPEPPVNGKWRKISQRKWEFRWNDLVLATIFHKPSNKFSLWFKMPNMYKKVHMVAADTYLFDTFGEAIQSFMLLLREKPLTGW